MTTSTRRLIILCAVTVTVLMLPFVGNSYAETLYRNETGHFSMIVPEGWAELSQSDLHEMTDKADPSSEFRPLAIFQKQIGDGYARIDVSVHDVGRVGEDELREFQDANSGTLNEPAGEFGEKTKKFYQKLEPDLFVYDRPRNLILLKHQGILQRGRGMVAVNAELFSNYGYVVVTLYGLQSVLDDYYEDFDRMLGSFRFDPGYQY